MTTIIKISALIALAMLTACGGGAEDDFADAPAPTVRAHPIPAAEAASRGL